VDRHGRSGRQRVLRVDPPLAGAASEKGRVTRVRIPGLLANFFFMLREKFWAVSSDGGLTPAGELNTLRDLPVL